MSRKAFIIWGLVIIQLSATLVAVAMYLAFSDIIDVKAVAPTLSLIQVFGTLLGFGTILCLRFKTIGRRIRILALCVVFYFASLMAGPVFLLLPYLELVVSNSGADDRFFEALYRHVDSGKTGPIPWTLKEKIDYILILMPATYLGKWGLFALLWFGSLDPRKPSKIRIFQFFKIGFRKTNTTKSFKKPKMVSAAWRECRLPLSTLNKVDGT